MIKNLNNEHNYLYKKKSDAKICLLIEMNTKLIFILTISLIVKIVSVQTTFKLIVYKLLTFAAVY